MAELVWGVGWQDIAGAIHVDPVAGVLVVCLPAAALFVHLINQTWRR